MKRLGKCREDDHRPLPGLTPWVPSALGAVALLVIVLLTLRPDPSAVAEAAGTRITCLICGTFGLVDVICNVGLFIPLGLALGLTGRSTRRALGVGLGVSLVIETIQAWVLPGRDATLSDLLTNTLGTTLGAQLARWAPRLLAPTPRQLRLARWAVPLIFLTVTTLTSWLMQPALTRTIWYGQRQPDLPQYTRFTGTLLDAQVADGSSLPSSPMSEAQADVVRRAPWLATRIVTGAATAGVAPIAAIFDGEEREQLLLGQRGDGVHLRVRLRAEEARLGWPTIRVPVPGLGRDRQPATIAGGLRRGWYEVVTRTGGTEQRVRVPLGPGWGWRLLVPFSRVSPTPAQARWFGAVWLGLLAAAGGWFAAADRAGGPAMRLHALIWLLTAIAALQIVPARFGLPVSPVESMLAVLVGLLFGATCWTLSRVSVCRWLVAAPHALQETS